MPCGSPSSDFALLAWHHRDALYRLARKWSGNSDDAWDLVQETYERALRVDHSRIPAERLTGWLFVVAKNLFRDHYRRIKRRRLKGNKEAAVLAALYSPDLEADEPVEGWRSMGMDDVQRAMASLSPTLATVWRMHVLDGLSYAEIAGRLHAPVATIGTRLLRARRQLRAIMPGMAARQPDLAPHIAPRLVAAAPQFAAAA